MVGPRFDGPDLDGPGFAFFFFLIIVYVVAFCGGNGFWICL